MNKKVTDFVARKRYKQISNIKLKDIFLNVNKEDVINFCMNTLNFHESLSLIVKDEDSKVSSYTINDKSYLNKKYDYYLNKCLEDYKHELSTKYAIDTAYIIPCGCEPFLSLLDIEKNVLSTVSFFESDDIKEAYPLELFLDCYISEGALKTYKCYELVGRFILQVIYIEEGYKMFS